MTLHFTKIKLAIFYIVKSYEGPHFTNKMLIKSLQQYLWESQTNWNH